jgi:CheY-like chemotaxis protein
VTAATRVVVVDDSADMRLSLGNLLTDIFMAGKDGLERIAAFKREWPRVRIIAMSGGGERARRDYLGDALHIGADAALHKPFTLISLKQALDRRA